MLKKRIESVDVLRGFVIAAIILVNTPGNWSTIYLPFFITYKMAWSNCYRFNTSILFIQTPLFFLIEIRIIVLSSIKKNYAYEFIKKRLPYQEVCYQLPNCFARKLLFLFQEVSLSDLAAQPATLLAKSFIQLLLLSRKRGNTRFNFRH